MTVEDEGSIEGTANSVETINFAGQGVSVSRSANKVTVTITGGQHSISGLNQAAVDARVAALVRTFALLGNDASRRAEDLITKAFTSDGGKWDIGTGVATDDAFVADTLVSSANPTNYEALNFSLRSADALARPATAFWAVIRLPVRYKTRLERYRLNLGDSASTIVASTMWTHLSDERVGSADYAFYTAPVTNKPAGQPFVELRGKFDLNLDLVDIQYAGNNQDGILSAADYVRFATVMTAAQPDPATEDAAGIVELATEAEMDSGATDKVPTAARVKKYVDDNAGASTTDIDDRILLPARTGNTDRWAKDKLPSDTAYGAHFRLNAHQEAVMDAFSGADETVDSETILVGMGVYDSGAPSQATLRSLPDDTWVSSQEQSPRAVNDYVAIRVPIAEDAAVQRGERSLDITESSGPFARFRSNMWTRVGTNVLGTFAYYTMLVPDIRGGRPVSGPGAAPAGPGRVPD